LCYFFSLQSPSSSPVIGSGHIHGRFQRLTLGALALVHPPAPFEGIENLAR